MRDDDRLGQILKGRYRIERLIHAGAQAAVYAGTDQKHGRVAIKLLAATDASALRRSYTANAVGHPSAASILDTGTTDDGAVFLVMELLQAKSLLELRAEHGGRLPVRLACKLADQGLDLLACAHAQGITHGEIELGNLFFTRAEQLKVLGFGKRSPGQAETAEDRDVSAFARVIATLLAGDAVETLGSAQVQPLVPPRIAAVIDRGLARSPEPRWQSASAMRAGLQLACQAELGWRIDRGVRQQLAAPGRRSLRRVWFAALGALFSVVLLCRESAHPEPRESPAQGAQSSIVQAAESAAPAAAREPAPTQPSAAAPSVLTAPARNAQPAHEPPALAPVSPRKPPLPELRMPGQRRPGVQGNITPLRRICGQLSELRHARSLSDEEVQLWLARCVER